MCDKCTAAKAKEHQPSLKMVALLGAMAAIIGVHDMPDFDIVDDKNNNEDKPASKQ